MTRREKQKLIATFVSGSITYEEGLALFGPMEAYELCFYNKASSGVVGSAGMRGFSVNQLRRFRELNAARMPPETLELVEIHIAKMLLEENT